MWVRIVIVKVRRCKIAVSRTIGLVTGRVMDVGIEILAFSMI